MALANDLMGLGESGKLASRLANGGTGPVSITAAGTTAATATQIYGTQFVVYVNATAGVQGVQFTAPGGDNVFHDHCGFAGLHRESAAQHHIAGFRIAFREQERSVEGACHFVADNQPAQRGGCDQIDFAVCQPPEFRGQQFAEFLGGGGVLKDQRALQVFGAMQAAGKTKMAL